MANDNVVAGITGSVALPQNADEASQLDSAFNDAMTQAESSLQQMAASYRLMKAFRQLGGIPAIGDGWTDADESDAQALVAAYAIAQQYQTERRDGARQIGTTQDGGDVAILGEANEVAVQGHGKSIRIVQGIAANGEQPASGYVVSQVPGAVGVVPVVPIIVAAIVVTAAVAFIISEVNQTERVKINSVTEQDRINLPIRLKQAGFNDQQAQEMTQQAWSSAQAIAASNAQSSPATSIKDTVSTVVWGSAVVLGIGVAAYAFAPALRGFVTSAMRK